MFSRQDPLFMIDVNPMVGVSIDVIEDELQKLIKDLQTNLVNKKELERIKAQVLATEIYQQDSIDYQARILGMIKTSIGNIKVIDEYTSKINSVTAKQIREVAKIFGKNLKTTVIVNNITKQ